MTATQLFSIAHGKPITPGSELCGLCGGSCDGSIPIGSILSDSFTDWQQISGDVLCGSCLLTLRADSRTDQVRLYSWVLTPTRGLRKTKADLTELRTICLTPPPPPYCIVLADSGQRHLIYRATVIHDPHVAGAYLEGEQIGYLPTELASRIELCGRICAATGKGALTDFQSVGLAIALSEYYREWESTFSQWAEVYSQPLSRLAAWLCENSEASKITYPSDMPPKKIRKGKHAGDSTEPTEPTSAPAPGETDASEVPPDHRGSDRPGRESGEPGLFG